MFDVVIGHPEFLIPAGPWAEWVGSAGAFLVLLFGGWQWNTDRKSAIFLVKSAQARNVAAWLTLILVADGTNQLQLTVHNTTLLPIRNITARAVATGVADPVAVTFGSEPMIEGGGKTWLQPRAAPQARDWHLTWWFQDEDGIHWEKVSGAQVRQIKSQAKS